MKQKYTENVVQIEEVVNLGKNRSLCETGGREPCLEPVGSRPKRGELEYLHRPTFSTWREWMNLFYSNLLTDATEYLDWFISSSAKSKVR